MNEDITCSRWLARKIGLHEAIFLEELMTQFNILDEQYKTIEINGVSGYFGLRMEEVKERTTLKRRQQCSCIETLLLLGLIDMKIKGLPGTRHFRVVEENFSKLCNSYEPECTIEKKKYAG